MKTLHLTISSVFLVMLLLPLNAISAQSETQPKIAFDNAEYITKKMLQCHDIAPFCITPLQEEETKATIIVTDPNANKFNASIDRITVYVWSDSDQKGIEITAYETDVNSGIFKGTVTISEGQSTQNVIHVSDGDTLSAKYIYTTLSTEHRLNSYQVMATSFVGSTAPLLEKIILDNLKITDNKNQQVSKINVGQQIQIISNVLNSNRTQPFAYLVQIQNEDQVIISLSWLTGSLKPHQSVGILQTWTPFTPGNYTVNIFAWQSIDNPNALCPPLSVTVVVQ